MKQIFTLGFCFLICFALSATSNRTENIDGVNNFAADEDVAGTSGSTWYFTWDATNFYFAVNANDVNSGNGNVWVHLYLNNPSAGTGSTTGVTYNTQTPGLPFNADYHFRWKADNSYTNLLDYNDGTGSWTDDNTGGSNLGIAAFQSGTYVEFVIPRASLGSPASIQVAGAMINETGGFESTFFMTPDANTEGYDANYTENFTFPLIAGQSPDNPAFNSAILPVDFLNFEVNAGPNRNLLTWTTATELNNDHFTIERSANGVDFQEIGKVSGAGTTEEEQHYRFVDVQPLSGKSYYRLRQVDYDGTTDYSETLAVTRRTEGVSIFPNPVKDVLNYRLTDNLGGGSLLVRDARGAQVLVQSLDGAYGQLATTDWTPGLYLIEIRDAAGRLVATERVIR